MKTHTPGPWIVAEDQVGDDDGNVIADVTQFNEWNTTEGWVTEEMPWEVNAKLIAAAPELLDVLQRMTPKFMQYTDEDQGLYLEAKALIAKLTDQ